MSTDIKQFLENIDNVEDLIKSDENLDEKLNQYNEQQTNENEKLDKQAFLEEISKLIMDSNSKYHNIDSNIFVMFFDLKDNYSLDLINKEIDDILKKIQDLSNNNSQDMKLYKEYISKLSTKLYEKIDFVKKKQTQNQNTEEAGQLQDIYENKDHVDETISELPVSRNSSSIIMPVNNPLANNPLAKSEIHQIIGNKKRKPNTTGGASKRRQTRQIKKSPKKRNRLTRRSTGYKRLHS